MAILVPYNAAFAKADRQTMASDVIVEGLFIVGELVKNTETTDYDGKSLYFNHKFRYFTQFSHHIRFAEG